MSLRRKSVWNVAEVIGAVLSQFVIFRWIIASLNIEALGIWSLVFAALGFARVADVGIAAGLARYVARAVKFAEGLAPMTYVETALMANLWLYLGLSILAFVPVSHALGLALHGGALEQARHLLPFALASFVLLNVSSVMSAALIGFGRSDLKSMLSLGGYCVQLILSWLAIRTWGLTGLAIAQIGQNVFAGVTGWIACLLLQSGRRRIQIPYRISLAALREMLHFGLKLQILSIASFTFDPVTKFALSIAAGPAAVGLYEAAYRLVYQTRALIVAPTQNLMPMFAAAADRLETERLYRASLALLVVLATPATILLVLVSPLVAVLLLGHAQPSYTLWVAILGVGWLVNTMAVPGQMLGIGTGRVGWNIVGAAAGTFSSLVLGLALGKLFGGNGALAAAAIAVAGGGILTAVGNCRLAHITAIMPGAADFRQALNQLRSEAGTALQFVRRKG